MKVLITGSNGLVGSEAVKFFHSIGAECFGIDNDMRAYFFGEKASTAKNEKSYCFSWECDIRDPGMKYIFKDNTFDLIIHAAAQPSHDWAATNPYMDFSINAEGTLNLLECFRQYCPEAIFIYLSTNKVYGDNPNNLNFTELEKRYECNKEIDESMSIGNCTHSLFGVSKLSGDLLTQEYGRYFGLKTGIFRCGCLTGPNHEGAKLHGFLSYLVKCAFCDMPYTINGYKGKQVRDNLHSYDLVTALYEFYKNPKEGVVYNMGGGRENSISILEAIDFVEMLMGKKFKYDYSEKNRKGDHIWYISDLTKFKNDYPNWEQKYSVKETIKEIYENCHNAQISP